MVADVPCAVAPVQWAGVCYCCCSVTGWCPAAALPPCSAPQVFVKCSGYLIGEYGRLLPDVPVLDQFRLLHTRFLAAAPDTKVRPLSGLPLSPSQWGWAGEWVAGPQG